MDRTGRYWHNSTTNQSSTKPGEPGEVHCIGIERKLAVTGLEPVTLAL